MDILSTSSEELHRYSVAFLIFSCLVHVQVFAAFRIASVFIDRSFSFCLKWWSKVISIFRMSGIIFIFIFVFIFTFYFILNLPWSVSTIWLCAISRVSSTSSSKHRILPTWEHSYWIWQSHLNLPCFVFLTIWAPISSITQNDLLWVCREKTPSSKGYSCVTRHSKNGNYLGPPFKTKTKGAIFKKLKQF